MNKLGELACINEQKYFIKVVKNFKLCAGGNRRIGGIKDEDRVIRTVGIEGQSDYHWSVIIGLERKNKTYIYFLLLTIKKKNNIL